MRDDGVKALEAARRVALMMSGLDGSGAFQTVLPWEAFGGHVLSGSSDMYWFDQSIPIHLF